MPSQPPHVVASAGLVLDPGADNYVVFGNPVAHSLSPAIHAAFARQSGARIHYQPVLVPPGGFAAALDRFQSLGGRGANVTLPFKGDAFAAVAAPAGRAARCGSVNTLWFDDAGVRHGDTTDGTGLMTDLARLGIGLRGRRVLVLGAGGAVGAVLADLHDAAPAQLVIANRTVSRARDLLVRLGIAGTASCCAYAELAGRAFDVVINGTSLGLAGSLAPLPDGLLAPGADCYDMIYGAGARPFCDWARAAGAARVSDGLGMLVEQAAASFRIWRGVGPDTAAVLAALRRESPAP